MKFRFKPTMGISKGHIKFWSDIRELRSTAGKLTENYAEKNGYYLDLKPKVANINRVQASAVSNHLAKTASKTVHPFGWNFVHWHTHRQTDSHTYTNCSENITPQRFCWGVKKEKKKKDKEHSENADTSTSVTFHICIDIQSYGSCTLPWTNKQTKCDIDLMTRPRTLRWSYLI